MIQTATIQITLEILGIVAGIDESKGAWRTLGTRAPDRPKDDTQVSSSSSRMSRSSCSSAIWCSRSRAREGVGDQLMASLVK
jgi:hypothetical protein